MEAWIAAGDFNQLKPVPNTDYNDPGHLLISHPDIRRWFPHHFVLMNVHRQSQGNVKIITFIYSQP